MTETYGDRLRRARNQVGRKVRMSQELLAQLSGVSRSWIADIESGSDPRLSDAIAIANALKPYGVDPLWLLFGDKAPGTVDAGVADQTDRTAWIRRAVTMPAGAPASLPGLDPERLGDAHIDRRLLDAFTTLGHVHAQLRPLVGPRELLPMVQAHLSVLESLIAERSAPDGDHRRLVSIASGVASIAAWTLMTLERRAEARRHLDWAESAARDVDDPDSLMLILLLRADMASPIPSGGLDGFPRVALDGLIEARSLASRTTPASLQVPLVVRFAEEHAFLGEDTQSHRALDEADRLFASLEHRDYYLRSAWTASSGILTAFRGNCLSLLGDVREAVQVIAPTVATARFSGTRSARIADLAAAHAQLGDVDRACELLEESLDLATGIGETEKARRVAGVRRRHLARWSAEPAVGRVDERLATIL